ncbi:hypothetical protein AB205_0011060, partial [Aquarana catesbeiana]
MQPLVPIICSHLCPSNAATCAHHMQPLVPIICSHLCPSYAATSANQMQPLLPIICSHIHLCPSNAARHVPRLGCHFTNPFPAALTTRVAGLCSSAFTHLSITTHYKSPLPCMMQQRW